MKKNRFAILLLASALAFGACSGGSGTPAEKVVNMVMFSAPDGFITYFGGGGLYTTFAGSLVFEGLVKTSSDYEIIPCLADSWEISDDSLTYTFHLNTSAKWHDGTPFTARDVEFTFSTILSPGYTGSSAAYLSSIKGAAAFKAGEAASVEGIRVPDDATVIIEMSRPYAPFLESNSANLPILPRHLLENVPVGDLPRSDLRFNPVGTGPCVFTKYVTDQYVEYAMNKSYYRGTPKFDKLIIKLMTTDAALTAFANGELDVTGNNGVGTMPSADYNTLKGYSGIGVVTYPTSTVQFLGVNIQKPLSSPLVADVRFRQAIHCAIDKQGIIDTLLGGLGSPSYTSLPEYSPYYKSDVEVFKYDPDRARALLADLGWDSKVEITMLVPKGQITRERMAPMIQSELAKVGINVKLVFNEFATQTAEVTKLNFDLAMYGTGSAMIDPNAAYYNFFYSTQTRDVGGWNIGRYSSPEFDKLLDDGVAVADFTARKAIYDRVQEYEAVNSPFVNIYYERAVGIVSDRLKNVKLSAVGPCWNICDWEIAD